MFGRCMTVPLPELEHTASRAVNQRIVSATLENEAAPTFENETADPLVSSHTVSVDGSFSSTRSDNCGTSVSHNLSVSKPMGCEA